ncbi:MAG: glycoside hydrolase family 127 protein [Bacteroidota bacterium]|nr:glycoside hydrolase family 127 protein [Bacteroidota bacterium]
MKRILLSLWLLGSFGLSGFCQSSSHSGPGQAWGLVELKYGELPLGAIRPEGWLLHQLQIMRDGSTGHLDEYYPKLRDDNGWLGGKGDAWEETPYWLDGALPLAYLLNDDTLIRKVDRYVNWTLDHQRTSGFFGPITLAERKGKTTSEDCDNGADWWPRMVMLKVLQQYYEATRDPRVIPFMTKYFRYEYRSLPKCRLDHWSGWASARGGDNLLTVYWLYRITHDSFLLQLAERIYRQTTPWTQYLGGRNWVMEAAAQQNGKDWMDRHGVNVAMGLKLPAEYFQQTHIPAYLDSLHQGWKDLMLLHGLPNGMFSADEDLHGNEPSQGTEFCAVVETMYSLEEILSITGRLSYADAAERIAFNILPGQTTDDYDNRQYFQMANQVDIQRGVYNFSLPFEAHMNNVFGPYAGYTCCTANMHQGWTKFTEHLWYASPDGGLAAIMYSPCEVSTRVGALHKKVYIRESTHYPFGENIDFTLTSNGPVNFPLTLRIPAWCQGATVAINGVPYGHGQAGKILVLKRTWKNGDQVSLHLPMIVFTSNWARNSRSIERGPLVYALKVSALWKADTLRTPGHLTEPYYEVTAASPWNYGLLKSVVDNPTGTLQVIPNRFDPKTFEWDTAHAPFVIMAQGKRIPGWKLDSGAPVLPVTTRDDIYEGKADPRIQQLTLMPYGCLKLRIVAFPVVP